MLPYSIKPLFGILLDFLIWKVKKYKYIFILQNLLYILLNSIIVTLQPTKAQFFLLIFLYECVRTSENIVCETILAKETKKSNSGSQSGQSHNLIIIFFLFNHLAQIFVYYFCGKIIDEYSAVMIYRIGSTLPFAIIILNLFYQEEVDPKLLDRKPNSFRVELQRIQSIFQIDKVNELLFVMVINNLLPQFDSIINFYLLQKLHFSVRVLSYFQGIAQIFYVIVLALYFKYMKRVSAHKILLSATTFNWLVNACLTMVVLGKFNGIPFANQFFCTFSTGTHIIVSELTFIPLLGIWCDLCPDNLEATTVTLFTGLHNLISSLSGVLGSTI